MTEFFEKVLLQVVALCSFFDTNIRFNSRNMGARRSELELRKLKLRVDEGAVGLCDAAAPDC